MILKLSEIKDGQLNLVGGKGLALGKLVQAGFPVPSGFVVTTEAFGKFAGTTPDDSFIDRLLTVFNELHLKRVAVRSSAIAEDSSSASWAGQLETYLNVDRDDLVEAIKKCWESINSKRAQRYAVKQNADKASLRVAVVVQAMVDSQVAGVMFTANPLTGNRDELMIEASYGLGEMIVQGEVTPDNYIVNKKNGEVVAKTINQKDKMMLWREGSNVVVSVPESQLNQQALPDGKISRLAKLGMKIEDYFGAPQDVEWCLQDSRLLIVQARPITTLKAVKATSKLAVTDDEVVTTGVGASQGIATGKARLITSLEQLKDVHSDEIVVTHKTTPDYAEAFSKIVGVVTESGGITSHAAIVSRELGIPAVVGTDDITLRVKDGDIITVDGYTGYVYAGAVKLAHSAKSDFVPPEPSGDDITDMVNTIAASINDANELWPLAPGQLMPYIDADQSIDMYQKLKQLYKDGMSESEVARLFERPIFIKMFLLNTGIVGMKSANVYEQRATVEDQVEFVEMLLKLAKILNQNDDRYVVSRNYRWSKEETSKFVSEVSWGNVDAPMSEVINMLSVNLLALNWALYWDYFPEAGHELHGSYEVSKFGQDSRMIVKDYFNLASGEVWEHAKDFPYNEVRLVQIYDTNKMYLNFGNRLIGEGLSKHNTHFALLVDGRPIKSIGEIQRMSTELKKLADKQTKHVNALNPMEKVRKGAEISYFARQKFYSHFSADWYPKDMVERTIKAIGTRFIDENTDAKPMSLEEKKRMWDPRTDWLP